VIEAAVTAEAGAAGDGGKLASLDGLRAVSIALVVLEHAHRTNGFPDLGFHAYTGDYGRLGVTIFFVISGLLITTLLLREREATGRISLLRFYGRRAIRIFPAFLAFMFAMLVADRFGWIDVHHHDLLAAFTYTMNYHLDRGWPLGHLWSLSVEEQFYVVWPFVLVAAGLRRGAIAALLLFVAAPLVRLYLRLYMPAYEDLEIFPAVADSIAVGCLLAIARPWLLQQRWYLRLTRPWILLVALPVIAVTSQYLGYAIVDLVGTPLSLILIGLVVEGATRWSGNGVGKVLNWGPMVYLGLISYSLYLWQQPFVNHYSLATACSFPLNVVLAVLCAVASYHLLETPLLNLRKRLGSPSHPA
jgi:peptidoglycan/LPS O-acetylase OafA/YrhL